MESRRREIRGRTGNVSVILLLYTCVHLEGPDLGRDNAPDW